MRKLTFYIILLCIGSAGFAQPKKIAFEKYGVGEGLPEEIGFNFIQDQQGFIWIGTQNGLVKYDGFRMKVFQCDLSNPDALHQRNLNGGLLLAQDGKIWIGGVLRSGGLSSFDPETEKFTNYPVNVNDSTKVPYLICYLLFEDIEKNIWFNSISNEGRGRLLCKLNPNTNRVSRYPFKVGIRYNNIVLNFQMAESKSDSSIWLKTTDGRLMRYDRKKDIFELIFQKGNTLPGTTIKDSIMEVTPAGKSGLIPLANHKHLYLFDPINRKVVESYNFTRQENVSSYYGADFEDEYGNFWVSAGATLTKINREQKLQVDYRLGEGTLFFNIRGDVTQIQPKYQNRNFIYFEVSSRDKQNRRFQSALRYDFNSGTFEYFDEKFNDPENQSVLSYITTNYMIDKTGLLWVGTRPNIYKESPKTRQIEHYTYNSKDELTLPSDTIITLFEDSKQRLWVGTSNGIALKMENGKFNRLKVFEDNKDNLSMGSIINIIEDRLHQIWVGSNKGVYLWSEVKNSFHKLPFSLNEGYIVPVIEDSKGRLWITAINKGVYIFDPIKGTLLKTFERQDKAAHGLTSTLISTIFKDISNQIWLGDILDNDQGLFRYVENEERFVHYQPVPGDSNSVSSNEIHFMAEDDLGRMWVGTDGGLNLYDPEKDIFLRNNDMINLISISCYAKASGGKMWFSTYSGGGLALVGPGVNDVIMFGEDKGLLHNDITGGIVPHSKHLAIDNFGKLWLPTQRGLSVFDPESKSFVSYFEKDGFQPYDRGYVSIKTGNGDIWIGSSHGLNRIVPANLLKKDTTLPSLVITQVTINDSMYSKSDGKIFKKSVAYTDDIRLKHWQKDISFEYVALHFLRPEDNLYSRKLENYDKEWSAPSKERKASYTNLSPGDYVFRVKAANADGVWNEEGISMTITILPPWWRTWLAYVMYALLFIVALRSYSIRRVRKLRKEKERLQEKVDERTSELKKSLEDLKSTQTQLIHSEKMASLGELTAGIAHEIQNPLNFVNNFSEISNELIVEMKGEMAAGNWQLAAEISEEVKQNLEKINHHGKHADAIVKGMLQHSRSNTGQKEPTDVNALAEEYLRLSYHGMRAKDKSFHADFKTDFNPDLPKITVVPQDIGRVLLNLINNAFYAVDQRHRNLSGMDSETYKPTVTVSTKNLVQRVEISVRDNGTGIPEELKHKIFQPFFTTKPSGQGTGLGLSLAYDIVKAHGGELKVETKQGNGATFTIILPV